MSEKQKPKMFVMGHCPSCNTNASFKFIGIQEWHPEIARQLNIPAQFALYRCGNCDSCVNEFALHDDSATAS